MEATHSKKVKMASVSVRSAVEISLKRVNELYQIKPKQLEAIDNIIFHAQRFHFRDHNKHEDSRASSVAG